MAADAPSKLYSPQLLALSTVLADYPLDTNFTFVAEERSRTCGSTIRIGIDLSEDGAIRRLGMQVSACAVGQSSAAILAQSASGLPKEALFKARAEVEAWLVGAGPLPLWPGFDALEPALPHKGRHGALLLPWTAALNALSTV